MFRARLMPLFVFFVSCCLCASIVKEDWGFISCDSTGACKEGGYIEINFQDEDDLVFAKTWSDYTDSNGNLFTLNKTIHVELTRPKTTVNFHLYYISTYYNVFEGYSPDPGCPTSTVCIKQRYSHVFADRCLLRQDN